MNLGPLNHASRPAQALVAWILCAVALSAALASWLHGGVSNQELLANFAKANDFLQGMKQAGGIPWWTPMFLQGTSLAFAWTYMVANVALLVPSALFGFLAGPKIAVILCLAMGALGVWKFLGLWTESTAAAATGALLFLLSPSVLTRAFGFEHFVVISSMALLPWTFWAISIFARRPSCSTAVLVATTYAAVCLAYGKTGVMALPAVLIFASFEYARAEQRPRLGLILLSAFVFCLLCVIPSLPALRESRFVAMFEFGPFDGWQRAFSSKSPISFVDWAGLITRGVQPGFAPTTANGGTFLGLGGMLLLIVTFSTRLMDRSEPAARARIFLALAFLMLWLSFGPKGVLGGQLSFLELSGGVADPIPALSWLMFVATGWAIFRLVPQRWPAPNVIASLLCAVFYLVPGFRLVEWLPIYRNIRAPFDFFQVTGCVCLVVALAILAPAVISQIQNSRMRMAAAAFVALLIVVDAVPYARPILRPQMSSTVFANYLAAADHLNRSKVTGTVEFLSGRYFYLLTPFLTGRPLLNEAFNSYLQQRGIALLNAASGSSERRLRTFLRISGVSHVVVDKTDPDTGSAAGERFALFLKPVFENDDFVVYENPERLADGFVAQSTKRMSGTKPWSYPRALDAAAKGVLALDAKGDSGEKDPSPASDPPSEGDAFMAASVLRSNYGSVTFAPVPATGWLTLSQAWHPDWTATVNGQLKTVRRALGAFPAVEVRKGDAVSFFLRPPGWYPACIGLGIASWIAALATIIAGVFRRRFQWKTCQMEPTSAADRPLKSSQADPR